MQAFDYISVDADIQYM